MRRERVKKKAHGETSENKNNRNNNTVIDRQEKRDYCVRQNNCF